MKPDKKKLAYFNLFCVKPLSHNDCENYSFFFPSTSKRMWSFYAITEAAYWLSSILRCTSDSSFQFFCFIEMIGQIMKTFLGRSKCVNRLFDEEKSLEIFWTTVLKIWFQNFRHLLALFVKPNISLDYWHSITVSLCQHFIVYSIPNRTALSMPQRFLGQH